MVIACILGVNYKEILCGTDASLASIIRQINRVYHWIITNEPVGVELDNDWKIEKEFWFDSLEYNLGKCLLLPSC